MMTWLNKLIRKAGSVVGGELDTLETVAIMNNTDHSLHTVVTVFSHRLTSVTCSTEHHRISFLPTIVLFYVTITYQHVQYILSHIFAQYISSLYLINAYFPAFSFLFNKRCLAILLILSRIDHSAIDLIWTCYLYCLLSLFECAVMMWTISSGMNQVVWFW